jgi:hypothetical protein
VGFGTHKIHHFSLSLHTRSKTQTHKHKHAKKRAETKQKQSPELLIISIPTSSNERKAIGG